jgi:hypothetical protein
MSNAKETLLALANYNSWRRGDDTLDVPSPSEIGAAIDDAVNLLRKYDGLESELAEARKDSERLRWAIDHRFEFSQLVESIKWGPDAAKNAKAINAVLDEQIASLVKPKEKTA